MLIVGGTDMNEANNVVNDPFAMMNSGKNDKEVKKLKKIIYVLIAIIVFLVLFLFLKKLFTSPVKVVDPKPKENLNETAEVLEEFIFDNHLDSLDVFGDNELMRVAISSICDGVVICPLVDGDAVVAFLQKVFNTSVTLTDVNCEINDGVLYKYDAEKNVFVFQNHDHDKYTKPIFSKVYSIKKEDGKYVLVLNKLYYDSSRSNYISTDPLGVYHIYNFDDYSTLTDGKRVLDLTRVISSYENNYLKLKEKGTRYEYTFVKKDKEFYLKKYKVLNS